MWLNASIIFLLHSEMYKNRVQSSCFEHTSLNKENVPVWLTIPSLVSLVCERKNATCRQSSELLWSRLQSNWILKIENAFWIGKAPFARKSTLACFTNTSFHVFRLAMMCFSRGFNRDRNLCSTVISKNCTLMLVFGVNEHFKVLFWKFELWYSKVV